MNKYRVSIWRNGGINRILDGESHCYTGPAIEWLNGYKAWYVKGLYIREEFPASHMKNARRLTHDKKQI